MRILDNLIYRAEKFNEAKAQYKLGIIYLTGDRVEPNLDEAKMWLERAADQGHEEAAEALEGLEGKPVKDPGLEASKVTRIQAEDYDQGTPPIMESESREPSVDWGDESSGPPLISRSELSGEDIGRKLGLQLKKVFGKSSDAVVKSFWVLLGILFLCGQGFCNSSS